MKYIYGLCMAAAVSGLMIGKVNAEEISWTEVFRIGQIDNAADDLNVISLDGFASAFDDLPTPLSPDQWPQIQPGAEDAWAGGKAYTFETALPMANRTGTYRVRIGLLGAHPDMPPRLQVNLAGHTGHFSVPRGRQMDPKDNLLQSPQPHVMELTIPAQTLPDGATHLTISQLNRSSWVFYDGIEVAWTGEAVTSAGVDELACESSLLVLRGEGESIPRQPVTMKARLTAVPAPATLQLADESGTVQNELILEANGASHLHGDFMVTGALPAQESTRHVTARLVHAGEVLATHEFNLPGYRPIEVFVVPEAHFDNGYTHPQEETVQINMKSLDAALDLADQHDNFSWTNESTYILQRWLESASEEDRQRLLAHMGSGMIGFEAGSLNMLTGLPTGEGIHRWLYWAGGFAEQHRLDLRTATLTDAPSHVWSVPQVLAASGIEFLSIGANPTLSQFVRFARDVSKEPFWWEGPDGSRVLTFLHEHYAHATTSGLTQSLEAAEARLSPWLKGFYGDDPNDGGYQYDVVHMHGAYWDNHSLDERLVNVVAQWNEKYLWPRITLTTNAGYFDRLRGEVAEHAKVFRGDQGADWEDGAASSAMETKLNRENARRVQLIEAFLAGLHAAGTISEYPTETIREIWQNIMLYDEHTWGAAWSIGAPDDPRTLDQFATKAGYAHRAAKLIDQLFAIGATHNPALRDLQQRDYAPRAGTGPGILSTDHASVTVDPKTGMIVSLLRAGADRNFVDLAEEPNKIPGFGQILYYAKERPSELPPNFYTSHGSTLSTPKFLSIDSENDHIVARFEHEILGNVAMTLRLATDKPRLDIEYHFEDKKEEWHLEGVYIAFPFAFDLPDIDYEVGGAVVRAGRDWMPRARLDWFSVQDFVRVQDPRTGDAVVWSSPDAPLVCLQDVNRHALLDELPINNGHVYSYPMNNYWFTNYKASQGGVMAFRYSISLGKDTTNSQAARSVSRWPDAVHEAFDQIVESEAENARIMAFKRAEDGDGYVLRVQEMDGRHGNVPVRLGILSENSIQSAELIKGNETGWEQSRRNDHENVLIMNNRLIVHMHPYQIQTVRVRLRDR